MPIESINATDELAGQQVEVFYLLDGSMLRIFGAVLGLAHPANLRQVKGVLLCA